MRKIKIPLLGKVLLAMVLGVGFAYVSPHAGVRLTATLSGIFSQILKFVVPLVIIGLVTPAIAETGSCAGKMLLWTVLIAYVSSVLAGLFACCVGWSVFPHIVSALPDNLAHGAEIAPFFTIQFPPVADVMTSLLLSFVLGLAIPATGSHALMRAFVELREVVLRMLEKLVIPLLPIYIFCIFAGMTATGKVGPVINVFARVYLVNFSVMAATLLFQYSVACLVARRNPLVALYRMLTAYATALGTASSAATIPVTLRQTKANGVSAATADFVIPLCATVHLSGSMIQITSCAMALFFMHGTVPAAGMMFGFVLLLAIVMVAAPGVPGGAIMAALGVLQTSLGFSAEMNALMITLYIAADSFGTACNVTGDGAIAILMDRLVGARSRE